MGKRGVGRHTARVANRAVVDEDCSAREPCSYCGVELRWRTYVVCAECAMPTVALCLDCFAAGAAWLPHHAAHDYRVIAEMHKPVFEADWVAAEESRLLDAISLHGPFSWAAVADVVETKGASECKAHYSRVYLESRTAPLPDYDVTVPSDNVQQGALAKCAQLQMPHAVDSKSAPMGVEMQRRRIQPIRPDIGGVKTLRCLHQDNSDVRLGR
jgi:Myb-like DNA-binding domain